MRPKLHLLSFHWHFLTSWQLRTKLAGEISVGPWLPGKCSNYILANSPPTTLIHDFGEQRSVSVIGVCPNICDDSDVSFGLSGPQSYPLSSAAAFNFSSAPLEDISVAKVFYAEGYAFCRGLLFEYSNGAQRALGNCRLGVDLCRVYQKPRLLCRLEKTYRMPRFGVERRAVMVELTADVEQHTHEEQGWCCSDLSGILRFWFTGEESYLDICVNLDE